MLRRSLPFFLFVAGLASATTSCGDVVGEEPGEISMVMSDGQVLSAPAIPSASSETAAVAAPPTLVTPTSPPPPWKAGEVVVPRELFRGGGMDRAVKNSNPRLYLDPKFDPRAPTTLVIGMPGWGGRSEKFIWTLINGLGRSGRKQNLAFAAIQDPATGGPRYQGQGARDHANVWSTKRSSVRVMDHFISRLATRLGRVDVYLVGYSTGGVAAPMIAARLPETDRYDVRGAVALGTGSHVKARRLQDRNQRVLFVVVPRLLATDARPLRGDQVNRASGEMSFRRLSRGGAEVSLRVVRSAKRHLDWHWGLISQCRFFPGDRVGAGRGYWPNYEMPNPETFETISAFIQGTALPAAPAALPATQCPG